jgi:cellulose synthase/poly-beta-1,6-N-acetylglucosamine synthase-like glycosyltransferase
MRQPWATALLGSYYLILGILSFYGIHRLLLVIDFLRTRKRAAKRPADPSEWPIVTVQLPLYNEMYVASRLIDAVAALDYPRDRLEIQVLDDSTDETSEIVARKVAEKRREGVDIVHLHRTVRTGFKAGALAAGVERARGAFFAILDADFVPRPDFLRATVPHFADPGIGMVQGSWSHINREFSLLTRVEAILLDGHFQIEHTARNRTGCFFNFNGTAGIWRREAILEGGGWQHDTLTEDLDLSYRAQLAGWRFLYLPEIDVPSELPVDVQGFKSQQYRWAKGSIQTGRKLLGRVLRARLPLRAKIEALVHLTSNASYVLMVGVALLIFPAMVLRRGSSAAVLLCVDLPLFLFSTLSVVVFYLVAQAARPTGPDASSPGGWRREARYLPALLGMGIGLSLNNASAAISGLFRSGGTFHRTPKYRIERAGQEWRHKVYRAGASRLGWLEGLFALYFLGCTLWALWAGMWMSIPFLYLFLQGFSYMFLLSVLPRFGRRREKRLLAVAEPQI